MALSKLPLRTPESEVPGAKQTGLFRVWNKQTGEVLDAQFVDCREAVEGGHWTADQPEP